ncbi:MAG: patatin-like phospholipase family protein [Clostridiales bacterium]|nr:patatin-like phospholipase family protein [Clostridiales bacterium]
MLGLALEGGGAKGAFQMGAIKALLEEGYEFDGVVGTSIGAINGAAIAQGDFELGYAWWKKMDTSMLFELDQLQIKNLLNTITDKESLKYIYSKAKDIIGNKGLDTTKIREFLGSVINEEKMRNSKIDYGLVTVSVSDLKPLELYKEDIPKGKMLDYIIASANFPVFRIEPIDGKYYLDGGIYDNLPINLLIRKGYDEIIAIRTLGNGIIRKVENKNVKIISILPSKKLGPTLNFNNELINTNLKMGYCDAMRILKKLKGNEYYIDILEDDKYIFESLLSIPDKALCEIGNMMKFSQIEPKRMLFEKILPSLARKLELDFSSTYQDIVVGVFEYMAEQREIEKYKVRKFKNFLSEIQNIKTTDKKSKFSNERIIERFGEEILKGIN